MEYSVIRNKDTAWESLTSKCPRVSSEREDQLYCEYYIASYAYRASRATKQLLRTPNVDGRLNTVWIGEVCFSSVTSTDRANLFRLGIEQSA